MSLFKNKTFLRALKATILLAALILLSLRLDISALMQMQIKGSSSLWLLGLSSFFALFALNLSLDALNWKIVQSIIRPIGLKEAFLHNLKSYALAFITPINSGELAGRYLVQKKGRDRQKTVFLTFWTHAPKLFAKISITLPMLFGLLPNENALLRGAAILVAGLMIVAYFNLQKLISATNHWQFKRFAFKNYMVKGRPLLAEKAKLLGINMIRFLCFSGQLATVLYLIDPNEVNLRTLLAIPVFYFITAVLPTWAAVDFLIKGALSLYFFQYFSRQEELFLVASTLVWLFNVAIPAIVGLIGFNPSELQNFRKKKS